jgi:hypothetical protein
MTAAMIEFSGREDVEHLLAEKMMGKSKNDTRWVLPGFLGLKSCESKQLLMKFS